EDLELVNKARARTENTGHGSDHVIRKSLASIYPHLASYVDVIRMDEIINEDFPSVEVLEKRQKGYIWVWGKLLDCSLEDVEKEYDIEIERLMVPRDSKEFTGMVACKGFARGRVRKIFKREQVGDVQEGEILVTSMTVPDFLPAMKKAAAFVTDEGGIVCHAVIIAREMGKPCIIGTKIATEMLRNGHEVEVDADNGVVRKV
ncbi:MAG: PEP-utilizing enzyme, partial [Candidatus Nanoarchaeia archaeon]